MPQRWPFCWWVAVVVDQVSRRLVGYAVFRSLPTSEAMQRVLDRGIRSQGFAPRCIVTDKGSQFKCASYRRWCKPHIRPRFGHLGEPSSIAIAERFIRSMKQECFRWLVVPMTEGAVMRELRAFSTWYNEHRPSVGRHDAPQVNKSSPAAVRLTCRSSTAPAGPASSTAVSNVASPPVACSNGS